MQVLVPYGSLHLLLELAKHVSICQPFRAFQINLGSLQALLQIGLSVAGACCTSKQPHLGFAILNHPLSISTFLLQAVHLHGWSWMEYFDGGICLCISLHCFFFSLLMLCPDWYNEPSNRCWFHLPLRLLQSDPWMELSCIVNSQSNSHYIFRYVYTYIYIYSVAIMHIIYIESA